MYIVDRTLTFARGFIASYGPSIVKKRIWDKEFLGTKWDFIDNTAGDCVYPYLEEYAHNGNILDLGCGPGNTANELASDVIDRMPVILRPRDYDRWLERDSDRPPLDLLRPFESEEMVKWACNPLVGNVKNNGPEMLDSSN